MLEKLIDSITQNQNTILKDLVYIENQLKLLHSKLDNNSTTLSSIQVSTEETLFHLGEMVDSQNKTPEKLPTLVSNINKLTTKSELN